jgi:hypothetical protein
MSELAWLVGHRSQSLTRREFDWVLVFDEGESLDVLKSSWIRSEPEVASGILE